MLKVYCVRSPQLPGGSGGGAPEQLKEMSGVMLTETMMKVSVSPVSGAVLQRFPHQTWTSVSLEGQL